MRRSKFPMCCGACILSDFEFKDSSRVIEYLQKHMDDYGLRIDWTVLPFGLVAILLIVGVALSR